MRSKWFIVATVMVFVFCSVANAAFRPAAIGDLFHKGISGHDVRAYGAKGDGSTDDTTTVQAALDAANAATGGIVLFPKGTYICSTLTVGDNTVLRGADRYTSIIKQKDSTSDENLLAVGDDCVIENITLDGNKANQSGTWNANTALVSQALRGTIRNCILTNSYNNLITSTTAVGMSIENNLMSGAGLRTLWFRNGNASDVIIKNNRITTSTFTAVAIIMNDGDNADNLVIDGNTVDFSGVTLAQVSGWNPRGFEIWRAGDAQITNNTVIGSAEIGAVTATAYDIEFSDGGVIANNVCRTNLQWGIECGSSNVTISNNVVQDASTGILISNPASLDQIITGNIIRNCSGYGIYAVSNGGKRAIITGNRLTDCSTDGTAGKAFIYITEAPGVEITGNSLIIRDSTVAPSDGITLKGSGGKITNNHFYTQYDAEIFRQTTIAFNDADPDTITDSGSGFVITHAYAADTGFEDGMEVVVEGSTSNDGYYTVNTVVAGTLTLAAGETLTDEVAGQTVTIRGYRNPITFTRTVNLNGAVNCVIRGNVFSGLEDAGISGTPVYLQSASHYNMITDNYFFNTTDELSYTGLTAANYEKNNLAFNSTNVSDGFDIEVSTMSGHETFDAVGRMFIKDPGGANRNFNPTGYFAAGHRITVVNTADAAESISFDTAGLNQAIDQNHRGVFVYDGTNWRRVSIDLAADVLLTTNKVYLQSANVAHATTNVLAADIGGSVELRSETDGGLKLTGISEDADFEGIKLEAVIGVGSATVPAVMIRAAEASGAGRDAIDAGEMAFAVTDYNYPTGANAHLAIYGDGETRVAGDLVSNTYNFAADTASDDDYIITLSPAPTAYTTGMMIVFTAVTANTGACTVNVNGLGVKNLKAFHDQDPPNNYIEAGSAVMCIYTGTNFELMSPDCNP